MDPVLCYYLLTASKVPGNGHYLYLTCAKLKLRESVSIVTEMEYYSWVCTRLNFTLSCDSSTVKFEVLENYYLKNGAWMVILTIIKFLHCSEQRKSC